MNDELQFTVVTNHPAARETLADVGRVDVVSFGLGFTLLTVSPRLPEDHAGFLDRCNARLKRVMQWERWLADLDLTTVPE